jgi:hypothetical protein
MREWRWPRAGKIKFSHLQFETTVYDWQGAPIALICFAVPRPGCMLRGCRAARHRSSGYG